MANEEAKERQAIQDKIDSNQILTPAETEKLTKFLQKDQENEMDRLTFKIENCLSENSKEKDAL